MVIFMETKPLAMVMIMVICLLAGFAYSYFNPMQTFFFDVPFTGVAIGFFLAGIVFFGYLAFLPAIFFGLQLGADKNAAIFLYIIPLVLATYAGAKLGFALQEDYAKKRNFIADGKKILIMVAVFALLAIAIELALPILMELWPKDLFGLNVVQGKNVLGLIAEITKYARR